MDLIQRLRRGFTTEDGYKVLSQRISRPTRVASPFGSKTALFVRGVCGPHLVSVRRAPSCGSPTILCVGPYICDWRVVGEYVLYHFSNPISKVSRIRTKKKGLRNPVFETLLKTKC